MYYLGHAPLAAAVSNVRSIGCITALTLPSPEALQAEIRLYKQLNTKSFGLHLHCLFQNLQTMTLMPR